MSKEAMTLALEALEAGEYYIDDLEAIVYAADDLGTHEDRAKMQAAITALREALAEQPAQQKPVTPCTHPSLGACSLREDGTASRWNCVMCGTEFVPKATNRWAEFNEATKRNMEHAEWYLSTHPQPAQQALDKMAENARELGLDYEPRRWAVFCQGCRKEWSVSYPHPGKSICADCDDKLAGQLAQQEPVAWKLVPTEPTEEMLKAMDECSTEGYDERLYAGHASSVYMAAVDAAPTPPAQRILVGLTDEEIDQGLLRSDYAFKTAEAWRAGVVFAMTKLKEKNT